MNKFHDAWREFRDLKESSLTRLHQHTQEHDTAIITAYRNNPSEDPNNYCLYGVPDSEQYEGSVNRTKIEGLSTASTSPVIANFTPAYWVSTVFPPPKAANTKTMAPQRS